MAGPLPRHSWIPKEIPDAEKGAGFVRRFYYTSGPREDGIAGLTEFA